MTFDENQLFDEYCRELRSRYGIVHKVLLVQVPQFNLSFVSRDVVRNKGYYAFPPTGLQYLYEALKDRGLDIRIFDLNLALLKRIVEEDSWDTNGWLSILEDYLVQFQPELVGVGCMYDVCINSFVKVLQMLKKSNDSIIVTGGIIPTFEWEKLLKRELCHFVVRGEGEERISCLLDHLSDQNRETQVDPNICFKYQNRQIGSNERPNQAKLYGNLISSYAQIELDSYHRYGSLNPFSRMAGIEDAPYTAIEMGRGCRGKCTFCAVHGIRGKGVRARPVDDIFDEIEYLVTQRGVKHFEWLDDDLLFHRRAVLELFERIIERDWKITWSAGNGLVAKSIDKHMLQMMTGSGCIGFRIGMESGNAEMLGKIRKPGTLSDFRRVSKLVDHYPDVFVAGNFIVGLPDETFSQMMDSFEFALEINLDWSSIAVCQVVRGASAFSDFTDYFEEQFQSNGSGQVTANIPSRSDSQGIIMLSGEVKRGYEIFSIDPCEIPSSEQVKEIWFAFNLIVNYIYNKNLFSRKRVDKFIAWVRTAQQAHPPNGYMTLFLALAYELAGDSITSRGYLAKALELAQTDYWADRLTSFGLDRPVNHFPKGGDEVLACIEALRSLSRRHFKTDGAGFDEGSKT